MSEFNFLNIRLLFVRGGSGFSFILQQCACHIPDITLKVVNNGRVQLYQLQVEAANKKSKHEWHVDQSALTNLDFLK